MHADLYLMSHNYAYHILSVQNHWRNEFLMHFCDYKCGITFWIHVYVPVITFSFIDEIASYTLIEPLVTTINDWLHLFSTKMILNYLSRNITNMIGLSICFLDDTPPPNQERLYHNISHWKQPWTQNYVTPLFSKPLIFFNFEPADRRI